ncbi:MAG: L-threonylcarbamoyladenylate synthase [Cyclobacteriaceae bacterium]
MAIIGNDILRAGKILESGGLVAIPTETVYGLAGNALNEKAVSGIFLAKKRPAFDPLIVHVSCSDRLREFAEEIPATAEKLIESLWPGPLTILLKRKNIIPDLVTSGLERAGFRCPAHPLTLELLRSLPFPLAAPSANPFGYISPTTAAHVEEQLGSKIEYILDGGPCMVGVESTIIGFENDEPVLYRPGGVETEELEKYLGKIRLPSSSAAGPSAPGQLISHYAPRKKMILGELPNLMEHYKNQKFAVLSFSMDYGVKYQRILSRHGDTSEAARNLFRFMRELDATPVDFILTEAVPGEGLGRAINDRLNRASA